MNEVVRVKWEIEDRVGDAQAIEEQFNGAMERKLTKIKPAAFQFQEFGKRDENVCEACEKNLFCSVHKLKIG